MKCSHCGSDIPDDSLFCGVCGNRVKLQENTETEKNQVPVFNGASQPEEENPSGASAQADAEFSSYYDITPGKTSAASENSSHARKAPEFSNADNDNFKDAYDNAYDMPASNGGQAVHKSLTKKQKIIGGAIAGIAVIAFFLVSFFTGRPLSDSKIKESIKNYADSETVLANFDIKDMAISHRQSEKEKYDGFDVELSVDANGTLVKYKGHLYYSYDKDAKDEKWTLNKGESSIKMTEVQLDEASVKQNFEEEIKKYDNFKQFPDAALTVGDITCKQDVDDFTRLYQETEVSIDNGFLKQNFKVTGRYICKESAEGITWERQRDGIVIQDSEDKITVNEDASADQISDFAKNLFVQNPLKCSYTLIGEREHEQKYSFELYTDEIQSIKADYSKVDDDTLKLTLEGTAESGILKNINFSGTVLLNLKGGLNNLTTSNQEITVSALEYDEITADTIIPILAGRTLNVGNTKFSEDEASTFVLSSVNQFHQDNLHLFVNGTATIDGTSTEIQVEIEPDRTGEGTPQEKKYNWRVDSVESSDFFSYEKDFSK